MEERKKIRRILLELGLQENHSGFQYAMDAAEMVLKDHSYLRGVTKRLYPEVARARGVTSAAVERNIRTAVERAWLAGDPEVQRKYFGNSVSAVLGRPVNAHFIAVVAGAVSFEVE